MPFEMLWDVFFSQKVLFWEAYQPCPSHPSFLSTTLEKQNSQCYHANDKNKPHVKTPWKHIWAVMFKLCYFPRYYSSWLMRVLITWLIVIQSYHRGVYSLIYIYIYNINITMFYSTLQRSVVPGSFQAVLRNVSELIRKICSSNWNHVPKFRW